MLKLNIEVIRLVIYVAIKECEKFDCLGEALLNLKILIIKLFFIGDNNRCYIKVLLNLEILCRCDNNCWREIKCCRVHGWPK